MPWLKWRDGENKVVEIVEQEAHQNFIHWLGGRGVDCHVTNCRLCELGDKPRERWSVEVKSDGEQWTWEMAALVWAQVQACAQEVGQFEGLRLRVSRQGEGRETRYTVVPTTAEVVATGPVPGRAEAPPGDDLRSVVTYAKGLCERLGEEPKGSLATFLAGDGEEYAAHEAAAQITAWVQWLEGRISQVEAQKEPEKDAFSLLDELELPY